MLLPNKLFSYNDSVLSKLSIILKTLATPLPPQKLYQTINSNITIIEFIDTLDCLYTLGEIDINDDGSLYKC